MTKLRLIAILVALGAGWGLTQPLTKIAVSSGHMPFGLIFWQLLIGAGVLGLYRLIRRKPIAMPLRLMWFFTTIALVGTLVPNMFSYRAMPHLPAGVMSVVISLVPIFAFPIALLLGTDRFGWLRFGGLLAGLAGVILLVGPESLPDPAMVIWVPVAMLAPLCYGFEGNMVAKWGTHGMGPGHVMFGASVVGSAIALPLALGSGQFINPLNGFGAPEAALVLSSVIHAVVYTSYVWLVGIAGATFAAQVAYLVTGFGVAWSMLLLGESYSAWVWSAMALIFVGMTLVKPKPGLQLASEPSLEDKGPKA